MVEEVVDPGTAGAGYIDGESLGSVSSYKWEIKVDRLFFGRGGIREARYGM